MAVGDVVDPAGGAMHIYPCNRVPAGEAQHWHVAHDVPRRLRRSTVDAEPDARPPRGRRGPRVVVDADASLEELQAAAERARSLS